jgi:membrane-associated protein
MDFLAIIDIIRAPLDGYRWLVREAVVLARELFSQYGYYVVFLGPCLENMLFLGLFIPGVFILLLGGISAYQGLISFPLALVLAIAGTVLGDTVSYAAGRFGWERALRHTQSMLWMDTIRAALLRRTALFVVCYHFMGYTRLIGPLTAGMMRLPFSRWWLLDVIGATLWVTTYMSIGYLFGRLGFTLDDAEENVRRLEWLIIGIALAGLGLLYLSRRRGEKGPPKMLEALAEPTEEAEQAKQPQEAGERGGSGG